MTFFVFLTICGSVFGFDALYEPRYNETCTDRELGKLCEDDCIGRFQKCSLVCSDQNCVNECKRESFVCLDGCPCHADCPNGCMDCENWACGDRCMDPETNPDVEKCHLVADHNLLMCDSECNHDVDCAYDCVAGYQLDLSYCPCGDNCLHGCPCDTCQNCTDVGWDCYCGTHDGQQEQTRCRVVVDEMFHDCWTGCGEDDVCVLDCIHERNQAHLECPCDLNCPTGCPCDGFDCELLNTESCEDPTTNPNTIKCFTLAERTFDVCAEDCFGNATCVHDCSQILDDDIDNCPCSHNCRYDCPCPFFDCGLLEDQPGEFESGNVLVVYNHNNERPVLFSFSDDPQNREQLAHLSSFGFEQGTGSYLSCSAMVDGQMMIFGGQDSYADQVSVVTGCSRLARVGSLPVDFEYGACTAFLNEATNSTSVLLCFREGKTKDCHVYNNGLVTSVPSSTHDHYGTALGMHRNKAIVVGSGGPNNRKIEEIDVNTMDKWIDMHDFPFTKDYIWGYSMVSFEGHLYLFGGGNKNPFDLAARFDGVWANVGPMVKKRWDFRSVVIDNKIMHIGGNPGDQKFELWTWNGYDFIKKESQTSLHNYEYYPESFAVADGFCG